MKKTLLLSVFSLLVFNLGFSQTEKAWKEETSQNIKKNKNVERDNFPQDFKLFNLNIDPLRSELFSIVENKAKKTAIISLPNFDGKIEQFEVFEASNFDAELQSQFPEIRAYSGKGITDKYATLKLSISPQGIQTMIFRTDKENEFIESYSQDNSVYAVFRSQRSKGSLPWTCSTEDHGVMKSVNKQTSSYQRSNDGTLKTMRLAQSCNGEYANYFGATSSAQVGLVLAAYNATLTRCNGIYERDLALHLNLVASSTNVIYYVPATDPYTTMANWNTQLQQALNTTLTGPSTSLAANNAAYDIGHMFGASGGGGNAGCIGCVCVDGVASGTGSTKGRGITSPANGVPAGDSFDIDYVAHEIGHQLGGNHTFSNSNEGSGVSKEVGSGITIMGYAGITGQDIAMNSIAMFHETTIQQIQNNLAGRPCLITTSLAGTNATPVIAPVSNYIIPISTPFVLTGSATDADAGDALTYCWEQNDDGGSSTGAASSASATKTIGPNFISFLPTASPSRYFPRISSVIANSATTGLINGGDAGMLSEALSSVARTLNFRLTVRDNSPYSSTSPIKVGQTAYTDMQINVTAAAGPFVVNAPSSTGISWQVGTNQTVTWNVAGTTANGVNATNVDIYLSTDGGYTYPILLASSVPNDGSETILVPNNIGSTNRIMVKGNNHVFFDISNNNFTITAPASTFGIAFNGTAGEQNKSACTGSTITYTFPYTTYGGYSSSTAFTVSGQPAGTTVTFTPNSTSTAGTISMQVANTTGSAAGFYTMIVTATSGSTKTVNFYLDLLDAGFGTQMLTSPSNNAVSQSTSLSLTWPVNPAATSYDIQVATDSGFTSIIYSGNVASNSYALSGLSDATTYYWRVKPKNSGCEGTFSSAFNFQTGQTVCTSTSSTDIPITISASGTPTINSTLNIASGSSISDLNITMNISHTWVADLTATLISPTGTQLILFSSQCGSSDNVNATFDDSGVTFTCGTNPTISGVLIPQNALSIFNNESPIGNWTLRIADGANADGGSLNSWSLSICSVQALSSESFNSIKDLSIYPNPNNGTFNIQFNSTSSSEIKVNVHDLRGREIYNNSFQNNGLFNESLQLNNVQSGIYLVTVQDGARKEVKKIIVE